MKEKHKQTLTINNKHKHRYCGVEGTLKKQVNIVTIVRKLDKNGNVIATTEEGHSNYEKPKDS